MADIEKKYEKHPKITYFIIPIILVFIAPVYLSGVIPPNQWLHGVIPGDGQLNLWALSWQWQTIPGDVTDIWNGNIFYPSTNSILGSDHMFSLVLQGLPMYWVTHNPFLSYYFVLFSGFAIAAVGYFFLGRFLFSDTPAAAWSALYFTIALPRTLHAVGHIQMSNFQWLPWSLLCLLHLRISSRWRYAVGFIVTTSLQILSCWYLAVFHVLTLLIVIPSLFFDSKFHKRNLMLIVSLAVIAMCVLPFAMQYMNQSTEDTSAVQVASARWTDYLTPANHTIWAEILGIGNIWSEKLVFPGYIIMLVILTGVIVLILFRSLNSSSPKINNGINSRFLAAIAAVGATALVLSLGSQWRYPDGIHLPFHYIAKYLEFFSQIRAPARFSLLVISAGAILGGWAMSKIRSVIPQKKIQITLTAALFVGLCVEQFPMLELQAAKLPTPAVYSWLKNQADDCVVAEIPEFYGTNLWSFSSEYMALSVFHEKKIVNGYSRYVPSDYSDKAEWMHSFPDPDALEHLQRLGVDYILLHPCKFFHDYMNTVFEDTAIKNDNIDALNRIIEFSNDNYETLESKQGKSILAEALKSPHLKLIHQFNKDYVFKIEHSNTLTSGYR